MQKFSVSLVTLVLVLLFKPGHGTGHVSNEDILRELKDLKQTVQKQGELLQEQEKTITQLKQTNHSSYPFLVGFADQTGNIVLAEQVVLWSDVIINPDGLYDTTTGAYTAPVTGYYEITCYLHTEEEDATFFINVNGVKITGTLEYDFGEPTLAWYTATSTIVLQLNEGDEVQIQVLNTTDVWGYLETEGRYSWFTGFLSSTM